MAFSKTIGRHPGGETPPGEEIRKDTPMRVREKILHSERQPGGAVTMCRVVSIGRGKGVIELIQTKGDKASIVILDYKEYRALKAFTTRKKG